MRKADCGEAVCFLNGANIDKMYLQRNNKRL
nr:MAG TPA: hypothetical protein [Caudoviricetes sp.]